MKRIRTNLSVKQAFTAFIEGKLYVMGLGDDNKIYYWCTEGWLPYATN